MILETDPLPEPNASGILLNIICSVSDGLSADGIVALCIAGVCLLISGFVSGSEISFFSLSPAHDEELEESPKRDAIRRLLDSPERLLSTILITNNVVNVTIVVLTSYALTPLFNNLSPLANFLLQTVLLTFLILLFGEILPKLVANNKPLRWAEFATGGINFAMRLFYPLSSVLVRSSRFVSHVVARTPARVTADDLSEALEITDVSGDKENKDMLEGILRFGDTTASEVMTPRVDITDIDIADDFTKVMKTVVESGFSRIPVYSESQDNIKGILYSRDLLPYIGLRDDPSFEWQKLLREPYFVPESRMIDDLLEDFRRLKIHMAIVIDEFGGTQGVVTLEDVLEEIVGDINDEYDEDDSFYKRLPDDTFVFEGRTLLTDFFRVTQLDPEEYEDVAEDAETLAGMLLEIKGDFPKEKESIVYGRCRFLVLDVEHHRIVRVRVKVMKEIQKDSSLAAR